MVHVIESICNMFPKLMNQAHLLLVWQLTVLGETEGELGENPEEKNSTVDLDLTERRPQGVRGASSPELTLDLHPARAAQEGPGLVPLLHRGHAGAQHLQPQVQHLLTGGGRGVLFRRALVSKKKRSNN